MSQGKQETDAYFLVIAFNAKDSLVTIRGYQMVHICSVCLCVYKVICTRQKGKRILNKFTCDSCMLISTCGCVYCLLKGCVLNLLVVIIFLYITTYSRQGYTEAAISSAFIGFLQKVNYRLSFVNSLRSMYNQC